MSENADFCKAISDLGVAFIGPPVRAIQAMGDKIESKQIAIDAGINTIPGFQGVLKDEAEAVTVSRKVRRPLSLAPLLLVYTYSANRCRPPLPLLALLQSCAPATSAVSSATTAPHRSCTKRNDMHKARVLGLC